MASIGSLIIDLIAKTGSFETDLGRAARTAEKRSKDIERSMSKLGNKIKGALGGLFVGFSFSKIIEETSKAEAALAKLDNAVKNNAGAAGSTTAQLAAFSSELQNLTTFSDESVQEMQALLLTFRQIGGPEFERAQVAILDLATALGKDLNSSALLVGRALADPVKGMSALSRSGIVLAKDQKDLINRLAETGHAAEAQQILLGELEKRFGGAAKAARNNFGGALAGLKNAFGDLLEAKGGLPEATAKINELATLLADPKTKESADRLLTGLISGGAKLVPILGGVVDGVRKLFGGATELEKLTEKLEFLEGQKDQIIPIVFQAWYLDGASPIMGRDAIVAQIKKIKDEIDSITNAPSPRGTGPTRRTNQPSASPIVAPPSEEFTKFAAKLNEQIALHGKVGEAAKLAYAIQSGALEELSDSEEKQLMALARRADAVAANTEAQKEAAEAQKKALADQQQAKESIESMVSALQQQVTTYEQGEAAVIRYRVEHGDLADTFGKAGSAADPYKQELIGLTEQMDALTEATKRQDEAQKQWEAAVAKGAAITESVRTPLEEYQSTLVELNDALNIGVISQQTYSRAIEKAQDSLDEATNKWTVFKDQAARNTQDIIADTLTNGFKDGADGILKAFADMIIKLTAQAIAADIAGKLFGKSGGGEGDGWLSALFGAASSSGIGGGGGGGGGGSDTGWIAALAGLFGGGRGVGGPVTAGTMYRVNEREPEYFKPNVGGKVVPLSKMPSAGGARITQNIMVQGRSDLRTARQMQVEAARQQRISTARLG